MLTSIQNITNKRKSRSISSFLLKTYHLLNQQQNNNVIKWAFNGIGFIVINQEQFSKSVLPKYFKHSNYSSFVRQLNMYNFHKIRESNTQSYFHHQYFDRSNQQILSEIKRKPQKKKRKDNHKNHNDQSNQSIQCIQYEDQCHYHQNKTQETVNKSENIESKIYNKKINHINININDNNGEKIIGNKNIKIEKENNVKKNMKNSKKRVIGYNKQKQLNIYEQQQKQRLNQQSSKQIQKNQSMTPSIPTTRQIFSSSLTIALQLQANLNNNNIDFPVFSNLNINNFSFPLQQQDDNDDKLSINNQIQQGRILTFPTKQLMYPSKYNLFPFKNNHQNNKFNVFY